MTLMSDVVALVNDVTLGLEMQAQGTKQVRLFTFAGDGGVGAPTYNPTAGKLYNAVVERKQRQVRTFSGELAVSNATVTFLVPTIVVGPHDKIQLPGDVAAQVIGLGGPVDASGQLITECYLG